MKNTLSYNTPDLHHRRIAVNYKLFSSDPDNHLRSLLGGDVRIIKYVINDMITNDEQFIVDVWFYSIKLAKSRIYYVPRSDIKCVDGFSGVHACIIDSCEVKLEINQMTLNKYPSLIPIRVSRTLSASTLANYAKYNPNNPISMIPATDINANSSTSLNDSMFAYFGVVVRNPIIPFMTPLRMSDLEGVAITDVSDGANKEFLDDRAIIKGVKLNVNDILTNNYPHIASTTFISKFLAHNNTFSPTPEAIKSAYMSKISDTYVLRHISDVQYTNNIDMLLGMLHIGANPINTTPLTAWLINIDGLLELYSKIILATTQNKMVVDSDVVDDNANNNRNVDSSVNNSSKQNSINKSITHNLHIRNAQSYSSTPSQLYRSQQSLQPTTKSLPLTILQAGIDSSIVCIHIGGQYLMSLDELRASIKLAMNNLWSSVDYNYVINVLNKA